MTKGMVHALSVCIAALAAALAFPGGILRLHIVANSDSAADQALKLAVRDEVLRFAQEGAPALTANEARQDVMENGGGLLDRVEAALSQAGADYGARLSLGRYDFPEREYMGRVYPAGEYQALRVVLGEGRGQNWWCVMFPPLCIIGDAAPATDGGEVFESLIVNLIRKAGEQG